MAFVYGDRVKETSLTSGTGTIALGGPTVGFRSFAVGVGIGNETFYGIVNTVDNAWEMGRGTVGPGTLTRDTVISSSNSNLLVNFTAGQKVVYTTAPSQFFAGALDAAAHATIDHTAAPFNLLNSAGHDAIDHTAAPFNLLSSASLPSEHQLIDHTAAPFNLLNATAHAAINHTAAPFNLLNAAAHQSINHTAAPFNLLNASAHQLIDHTAAPFNLLTTAAHAAIDHTGIPGAGLSAVREIILPKGAPWAQYYPETGAGGDIQTPSDIDWGTLSRVDDGGGSFVDSSGEDQYGSFTSYLLNADYQNGWFTDKVPDDHVGTQLRFACKWAVSSFSNDANIYFGFGDITGSYFWNSSFRHVAFRATPSNPNWRVVSYTTSLQPEIDTGVAHTAGVPRWFVIDWSSTPSVTLSIRSVSGTTLFTTTLTGAQVPPTTSTWPTMLLQSESGGTPGSITARFYSAIISQGT